MLVNTVTASTTALGDGEAASADTFLDALEKNAREGGNDDVR